MDLAELNFRVNTKELLDAVQTIDKVANAIKNLNDANSASNASTNSDNSPVAHIVKQAPKAVDSTDKVNRALEKQAEKMKILRNETITVADGIVQLGDGFTNSQAGMLANLKLMNATESQMKALAASFVEYNKITGVNTFDKSAAGLEKLKKSIAETQNVTKLSAEGFSLTREQLILLSRDMERVTQAFQSSNGQVKISDSIYTNLDEALKRLKTDFVSLAGAVNSYEQEAKEAEIASKKLAAEKMLAEQAGIRMNEEAVSLFIKNEQKKQQALQKTIRTQEESAARQRLMEEGYSKAETSRIVTVVRGGGSESDAKNEIAVARQVAEANKENLRIKKELAHADTEKANAAKYLIEVEKHLAAQIDQTNNLTTKSTDQLVKYKDALRVAGINATEAANRTKQFQDGLNKLDFKEKERDIRNLGRAMSTQMGDVAISLASGMNPLLVAIQQGDQIRYAVNQSTLAGKEMSEAMKAGAAQIATSFMLTGKIIGQFFVGSIISAGKHINTLIGNIIGSAGAIKYIDDQILKFNGSTTILGKSISSLGNIFNLFTGILTAGAITALVSFGIAAVQVMKEQDKLAASLALTGGALGLTFDSAMNYAQGMRAAGVSTSKAIEVISEMGKTGNLVSKEIDIVTRSAVELEKYGGVAIDETVKKFSDLKKDPVDALVKVAKETGMVTAASIELVDQLREQGKGSEAAAKAMEIYADVTAKQISRMKEDYSAFGLYVKEIIGGFKLAWDDVFRAMMRATPKRQKLVEQAADFDQASLNPEMDSRYKKYYEQKRDEALAQIRILDEQTMATEKVAEAERKRIDIQKEARDLDKKNKTDLDNYLQKMVELKEKVKNAANMFGEGSKEVKAFQTEIRMLSEKQAKILASEMRPKNQKENKDAKELEKAMEVYNDILNKGNGLTKEYNNQVNALMLSLRAGKISQEEFNEAFQSLVKQQPFAIRYQKELTKESEDYIDALERLDRIQGKDAGFNKDYVPTVKKLVEDFQRGFFGEGAEGVAVLEKAVELLTKQQPLYEAKRKYIEDIEKMLLEGNKHVQDESASLEDSLAKYKQLSVVQSDITIEAERQKKIREIAIDQEKKILEIRGKKGASEETKASDIDKVNEQAAQRLEIANRKAAQAYREEFDKFLKPLTDGVTDSIVTALFEGGKEGRKKLRDLIVTELKKPITLVLNVFLESLVNDFLKGLSSNNEGGSSGGSNNKNGSGVLSTIDSLVNAIGGKYEAAIGKAYSTFATSSYGQSLGLSSVVADESGGHLAMTAAGETGAGIASATGYGIAGYGLYKGISGGYETNKLVDIVGKFAGFFGPYGVVVSAIAGAINRLFGNKLKDVGVQGSFGGESGFQGETYQFYKGGLLRSDETKTGELDSDIQQFIGNQFKEVRANVVKFVTEIGVDAAKITDYTKEIKFSTKDMTGDQIAEKLQKEFEASAEEMAKLVLEGTNLRKGQETYLETLARVSETVKTVNESLDALGLTMFDVSLAGTEAAVNFADLFGGLDKASAALQSYYSNFYKAEEKTANVMQSLTTQFEKLGVETVPTTKEAFRQLVEEADAAGNTNLVATLIQVSGAFSQLMDELEYLRPVEYFIEKLQEQKRTNEEIAQSIIELNKETTNLQIELLKATGQIDAANRAAYELATKGMSEAEKAIYDFNESLRQQIDIANERKGLENDLLRMTNNTVELRRRELEALDPANRALKEFINTIEDTQKLNDAIDQQLPKFLPKEQYRDLKFHQFGQKLLDEGIVAGVAVDTLAAKLRIMSREDIYATVVELMGMNHMTDQMRITLVETAGAIADFNDEIADFEKTLKINDIQKSLDTISKFIGDVSVVDEPKLTLSEQYVKNKEILGSILDFFGEKAKTTVEDVVNNLLEQAQALKNFRSNLKGSIEDAKVKSMTKPERVTYLKKREQSLYAELQTAKDPVAVAQKIQDTIIERLQTEADIREELANKDKEANDLKKKSLEDQITSLEKIKDIANQIHQFTSSLRFSDLSPLNYQDQLGQAKTLFDETLAKAKTGDENAISNLIENARAYIEEARSYFASGTDYASIFNEVTGSLDAFGMTPVDPQLDTLYKQLDALEAIEKNQFDTDASVRQMNEELVSELGRLDEAVAAREEKTRDLLTEQRDLLVVTTENQKAQIEQWKAIAEALIKELDRLNETTDKTLEQVLLENAAPQYDSEGRRLN